MLNPCPANKLGLGWSRPPPRNQLFAHLAGPRIVPIPGAPPGFEIGDKTIPQDPPPSVRTKVRPSPGRGLGLFAVDPIPRFTKILEDDALLSLSLARGEDLPDLWEKYLALPPEDKTAFNSLSCQLKPEKEEYLISKLEEFGYDTATAQEMARIDAQWQSNAFKNENTRIVSTSGNPPSPTPDGLDPTLRWNFSLFANVARINHSCAPNARASYRPHSGAEVVYSLCDIAAGEEIEIAYFDLTMDAFQRKARARNWGFECRCRACEMPARQYKVYAKLLNDIREENALADRVFREGIKRHNLPRSLGEGQENVRRVEKLLERVRDGKFPWLVVALPLLYRDLATQHMRLTVAAGGGNNPFTEKVAGCMKDAMDLEEKITGFTEGGEYMLKVNVSQDLRIKGVQGVEMFGIDQLDSVLRRLKDEYAGGEVSVA